MTKLDMLERALFVAFVVATNALVALNLGWVLLTTLWNSILSGVVPIVSVATLVTFLAFAVLEDHLRSIRCRADGFQP